MDKKSDLKQSESSKHFLLTEKPFDINRKESLIKKSLIKKVIDWKIWLNKSLIEKLIKKIIVEANYRKWK